MVEKLGPHRKVVERGEVIQRAEIEAAGAAGPIQVCDLFGLDQGNALGHHRGQHDGSRSCKSADVVRDRKESLAHDAAVDGLGKDHIGLHWEQATADGIGRTVVYDLDAIGIRRGADDATGHGSEICVDLACHDPRRAVLGKEQCNEAGSCSDLDNGLAREV